MKDEGIYTFKDGLRAYKTVERIREDEYRRQEKLQKEVHNRGAVNVTIAGQKLNHQRY